MTSLRLIFMGTPDFAVPSLLALAEAEHEIAAVYSQPPRPAGRGHRPRPSPVHRLAAERGWPVHTPRSLRNPEEKQRFAGYRADAAVVAAYGLILPAPILESPRLGCLNVHASLLPRWRGAAPIQHAILAGDRETGITIMCMDEGLDTGDILLARAIEIGPKDTAGDLHDRLAVLGADLIVEALAGLAEGRLQPQPQPSEGVTYATKFSTADARIDWTLPADALLRQVRAFAPVPGAWTRFQGERLKVLDAEPASRDVSARARPGTVLDNRLTVACGTEAVRLTRLQRPGKAPVEAAAFLRGFAVPQGSLLS